MNSKHHDRTGDMSAETSSIRKKFRGSVTPPADMIEAARKSLSPEGFERLMKATGGAAPTPAQLCREVELERGTYREPEPLPPEELKRIRGEAFMIAAAKQQLSDAAFKALMHSIDWRAPTAAELAQAVDAERARKH